MMPCEHCDNAIHFGPGVAALRDVDDLALDNARISRLAWYHTSTSPDWPSPAYEAEQLKWFEEFRRQHPGMSSGMGGPPATKALHVGTYQAAIVNMLRRMRNQGDAASQFYLYRVGLAVDPGRVNDGYRDENHEPAAQLTVAQLLAEELSAIRYLNVFEDMGSLSLALLPESIRSLQRIALPIVGFVPDHGPSLDELIDRVDRRVAQSTAEMPNTSGISPGRLRLMALAPERDPSGIGARVQRIEEAIGEQESALEDALAERYLDGVCPVVADKFRAAVGAWRSKGTPTRREFTDFYAASAYALTRPDAVMRLVAGQEAKPISTG
ncbi:hypothetical protein Ate01nite_57100 [Actinoplanes teichomyceticus]|nr:hypothetical protein Ate01nite_57100 [Actinoplanes teichomyceticus]